MSEYKVVLEIEIEAESPIEAVKEIQEWLDEGNTKWQYYIQKDSKKDDTVYSIDLSEEVDDQIQEVDNYIPLIK